VGAFYPDRPVGVPEIAHASSALILAQTLVADTEICYQVSQSQVLDCAEHALYDDSRIPDELEREVEL
jgi:hypothetical protein